MTPLQICGKYILLSLTFMAKKLPFHGKKTTPEMIMFPNERFGNGSNFSGQPCPSSIAFEVLGMDTINEVDALLKKKKIERQELCGDSVQKRGLHDAQLIRTTDNVDVYCNAGLLLHDEDYKFPEKITENNYTVMLTTEFISDEVSRVMEVKKFSKKVHKR